MKRKVTRWRPLVCCALALVCASVAPSAVGQTRRRPNIVFVITDDQRWDSLGATGHPFAKTPHIDSLARAGRTADGLALNIDVAPTLLEIARAAPLEEAQGRSLVPLLRGERGAWRESFLAEYFLEKVAPRAPSWQAVRTARWKYIRYTELEGMDELYDLHSDPLEMKNLINDPAARAPLARLRDELERLKRDAR